MFHGGEIGGGVHKDSRLLKSLRFRCHPLFNTIVDVVVVAGLSESYQCQQQYQRRGRRRCMERTEAFEAAQS